jgi:hypothetical protein
VECACTTSTGAPFCVVRSDNPRQLEIDSLPQFNWLVTAHALLWSLP